MPDYIGLKEFARGVQKLYASFRNVPVFLKVDGRVAPIGIAVQMTELLDGEAIVLVGGESKEPSEFKKGTVTE